MSHIKRKRVFWAYTNSENPKSPTSYVLALVNQLDKHPSGDEEVAGSTPARLATFFHGDLIMKYFYGNSLPSADSRRAGQFLGKKCAYILDNH